MGYRSSRKPRTTRPTDGFTGPWKCLKKNILKKEMPFFKISWFHVKNTLILKLKKVRRPGSAFPQSQKILELSCHPWKCTCTLAFFVKVPSWAVLLICVICLAYEAMNPLVLGSSPDLVTFRLWIIMSLKVFGSYELILIELIPYRSIGWIK